MSPISNFWTVSQLGPISHDMSLTWLSEDVWLVLGEGSLETLSFQREEGQKKSELELLWDTSKILKQKV